MEETGFHDYQSSSPSICFDEFVEIKIKIKIKIIKIKVDDLLVCLFVSSFVCLDGYVDEKKKEERRKKEEDSPQG